MKFWISVLLLGHVLGESRLAAQVQSDGSDGPFAPLSSQTIDMKTNAPDGVFNFTTIHIPAGVVISFAPNFSNTPVFLAATGDILIEGGIDVSGWEPQFGIPGPGGGQGGTNGTGAQAGQDGLGPGAGHGGSVGTDCGYEARCPGCHGGGAGNATPGLTTPASTRPTSPPARPLMGSM